MSSVGLPASAFTAAPHWEWLIVFYFFIGGIAGGAYLLAALVDFLGRPEDRPVARVGYYVALPAVLVSGVLLILDLSRPLRFWHMLLESHTWQPMLKWWSPMSLGSWALAAFGLFVAGSAAAALAESGRLPWGGAGRLRPPHPLGAVWAALGALLGLFVAGYTGVLLSVTNAPLWTDTDLLGLVFVLSGASTAAALVLLVAHVGGWRMPALDALARFDSWVLAAELVALIALAATLGTALVQRLWLNWWGALLVVGVLLAGIVVPLVLEWRARGGTGRAVAAAAVLVLVGGFVLRVVVVMSPEAARVGAALGTGSVA